MREKLADHCSVISGYAFKSADLKETGDIPVVKIGNISNGKAIIIDNVTQYVSSSFLSIDRKFRVNKGDILISLTGSHMNQPNSMVGRSCRNFDDKLFLLNQRAGKVICKENTNSNYLYYLLNTKALKDSIVNRAYGSANQVNVSPSDIMKIKWEFPPKKEQETIGNILALYDELIETNNKRIKVLEQMAEEIYKEWFVRFRFPGHESAEFENGIPKGWIHCKFNEIYNTVRGVSYSSDEIDCDDGMDLINLKNIQAYGGFRKDGTKKYCGRYKSEQIVEKNSLVMGVTDMTQERRTVGSVALVPDLKGVISADLILLQSEISNVFSYYHFKVGGYSRLFSEFGNGANVIHLKPDLIRNQKILVPTNSLVNLFEKKATRITDQINNLEHQIDILIKQRDLLLPRLMSGKLEV